MSNEQVDPAELDRRMMVRAIRLARHGEGRVEPNPMVGCIIARGDRVIGEGYHRRFGGPHAEVEALTACTEDPAGATAYVSLEPCNHQGKTPPCTEALLTARIARVVAAVKDPFSPGGSGLDRLREAGLSVESDLLRQEAADVLAPYLTRQIHRRPYIMAKWAQSLDGRLATETGDSKWVSSTASRRLVHRLRARVDAIIVGVQTVIRDDPMLTARDVRLRRTATRVVLDTHLRTPDQCRLVTTAADCPTLIVTSHEATGSRQARHLRERGAAVIGCSLIDGRIAIADCMKMLYERDATNAVVEGGATLLSSFFADRLVDEAWVFTAPFFIGGSPSVIQFPGSPRRIQDALHPRRVRIRRVDMDVFHRLLLADPPLR